MSNTSPVLGEIRKTRLIVAGVSIAPHPESAGLLCHFVLTECVIELVLAREDGRYSRKQPTFAAGFTYIDILNEGLESVVFFKMGA